MTRISSYLPAFSAIPLLACLTVAHAQVASYDHGSVYDLDPPAHQSTSDILLEQIIEADDMELVDELAETDVLRRLGRPVGRLALGVAGGGVGYCTASLIARDLILTNYHCIPGDGDIRQAVLWMGYLKPNSLHGVERFDVDVTPVEQSQRYDYSILRVAGNPGDTWGTINLSRNDAYARQSLVVIHHPGGFAQRISLGRCRALDPAVSGDNLLHGCDTLPGSSGAPIFAMEDLKFVGLHFAALDLGRTNAAKRATILAAQSQRFSSLSEVPGTPVPPAAPVPPVEPPPGETLLALYEDVDFYGGDVAKHHAPDLRSCAQECADDVKCNYFTYISSNGACLLKNSYDYISTFSGITRGKFVDSRDESRFSLRIDWDIYRKMDFSGNDFDELRTVDFVKCLRACEKSNVCVAFSFAPRIAAKNNCWLKHTAGQPQASDIAISGNVIVGKKASRVKLPSDVVSSN